jgi:cell shape-determining protein MreC
MLYVVMLPLSSSSLSSSSSYSFSSSSSFFHLPYHLNNIKIHLSNTVKTLFTSTKEEREERKEKKEYNGRKMNKNKMYEGSRTNRIIAFHFNLLAY